MKIEYLEEFELLAGTLNYSKVARQCHLSTSVLSRHIASLENEVGDQLFYRDTTSVSLTPVGQRFFEGIVPILDQYRAFMRRFDTDPIRTQRLLNITLIRSSVVIRKTASRIAAQLNRDNGITIAYSISPGQSAPDDFSMLFDGRADAVTTYASSHVPDELVQVVLHRDPFVAIVPVDHPLAQRPSISLERDLAEHETVILKSPEFQAGANVVRDAFTRHGVTPRFTYLIVQSQDELCLTPSFKDVLPVPRLALDRHSYISPETHVVLPFEEDDLSFSIALVYHQRNESGALLTFRDALKAECEKVGRELGL